MRDEAISLKKYRDDNKLIEAGLYQEPEDQPSELDGVLITMRSHHQMSHIIHVMLHFQTVPVLTFAQIRTPNSPCIISC